MNKCKICEKEIQNKRKYCSLSCRNRDPEIIKKCREGFLKKYDKNMNSINEKRKETFLKKYGVDHPMKIEKTKEKVKNTNLQKYGVDNVMKVDEIKNKFKKNNLVKYGVENPFQSKEIKEKIKQTNLTKYKVENAAKSTKIKEKIKEKFLEKYGVEILTKSPEIKEKINKTNLQKYGVEYPLESKEIREKAKETNLQKYGVEYPLQSKDILHKISSSIKEKYGVNNIKKKHIKNMNDWENNFAEIYEKFGGNVKKLTKYFDVDYTSINQKSISLNLRSKYESSFEIEIKKLLDLENVRYIQNKYNILEGEKQIDLYLIDYDIAIECNGLKWHCEIGGNKNKYYHLDKTIKCNKKNIHLIHIWEHLWNLKRDIYWSIIKSHLGLNQKIYAKNCELIEIDSRTARQFYDTNHIQGFVGSSIHLGLKYRENIVAMMSFCKSRFSKKYEYEMTRYCCTINNNVVGGPSKLLNYFKQKYSPNSIIAYSDRSIFSGKMYEKLGFEFGGYSGPNYWYTNDYHSCYSRIKFQKHKLSQILTSYNPELTEWVNMKNNGWDRYWDCGNGVWYWVKKINQSRTNNLHSSLPFDS